MNPRRTNRLRKEQQRGSALLLALFFLVLLYLIAVALFRLIPGELHSVGRTRQDMQAHYAAAAGVKHATAWLQSVITTTGGVGAAATPANEPFGMPAGPNRAYVPNMTGNSSAKFVEFGRDFDNVLFTAKPYLECARDLQVDTDGDGTNDWFVHVWIFPDRATYPAGVPDPLPHPRSDLAVAGQTVQSLRYYTVVAEASPFQANTPRMRVKVTIGQQTLARYARFMDEWPGDDTPANANDDVPYSAFYNQTTVDGPFHTNSFFRIAPGSGYFTANQASPPANHSFGLMTFAGNPASTDHNWDTANWYDGVGYMAGNYNGNSNANLPWNSGGGAKPMAYEKLVGNRANLSQIQNTPLPSTTINLQQAAWGFASGNPVPQPWEGTDGAFIHVENGTINGGVYVKSPSGGGVKDLALGVGGTSGAIDATNVTAAGNPAMALIQSQQVNPTLSAPSTTVTPSNSTTYLSATVVTPRPDLTVNVTTGSNRVNNVPINITTYPVTGTQTTSVPVTLTIGSTACGTVQGQGMGQVVTNYCPVTSVSMSTRLTPLTGTVITPTTTSTWNYTVTQTTQPQSPSTTYPVTGSVVTSVNVTSTQTAVAFNPTDRVYEVKEVGMTVGTLTGGTVRMAGANGTQKIVVDQNGVPLTQPLLVGTGKVLMIKDSRTAGDQIVVQTMTGTLNGMVYSENNIDNMHGVNKGRRTVAVDIGEAGNAAKPGMRISIGNSVNGQRADIKQWGLTTGPGRVSPNGENVLGIVGQRVGINIRRQDFGLYTNNDQANGGKLQLYAIILAGRGGVEDTADPYSPLAQSRKGGFIIYNLQSTFNGAGAPNNGQNSFFKLTGGLIERLGYRSWQAGAGPNPSPSGAQLTGWNSAFAYDDWAAQAPPPFFPVTSNFTPVTMQEQFLGTMYHGGLNVGESEGQLH